MKEKRITSLSYLNSISDGDPSFQKDIIQTFIDNTPSILDQMNRFLKEKEWKKAGDLAHALKPSFTLLGMEEKKEIVMKIENYGKEGKNLKEIPELMIRLQDTISIAIKELKTALNEL